MKATLLAIVPIIGVSTARFLQQESSEAITFSVSLPCGKCIQGGFISCVYGGEGQPFPDSEGNAIPSTRCCKDEFTNCPFDNDKLWSCSNSFKDSAYAKFVCPFNKDNCGEFNRITIGDEPEGATIKVFQLEEGQTCFYTLESKCNAPSFEVDTLSGVAIEYIELFNGTNGAQRLDVSSMNSNDLLKKSASPANGFPSRDATFKIGGNQLPADSTISGNRGHIDNASGKRGHTHSRFKMLGKGECELSKLLVSVTAVKSSTSLTLSLKELNDATTTVTPTASTASSSSGGNILNLAFLAVIFGTLSQALI